MRAWSIITTFIFYTLIIPLVYAIPRNKTIDDVFGDDTTAALPTYSPGTAWHRGDQCDGCLVQPDTTQAFDGTWHDATHSAADTQPVFMELSFNGSAIYVYGILANQVPFATTATNLTFTLDGAVVGTFVHVPDSSSDFIYNVPFYTNPSLPMGQHTLHIESNAVTQSALILFDYAIYTIDDGAVSPAPSPVPSPSPPTSSPSSTSSPDTLPQSTDPKPNIPAIAIGASIGGICTLSLLLFFLYLKAFRPYRHRYKYRRRGTAEPIRRASRREIDTDEFTFAKPPLEVELDVEGQGQGQVGMTRGEKGYFGDFGGRTPFVPTTPTKSEGHGHGHGHTHTRSLSNGISLADPLLSASHSYSSHYVSLGGHQRVPSDTNTNTNTITRTSHTGGFSPPLPPLPATPGWSSQRPLPSPRLGGGGGGSDGGSKNMLRAVNAVSTDYSAVSIALPPSPFHPHSHPHSPSPSHPQYHPQPQPRPRPRRRPSEEDLREQVRSLAVELERLRASGLGLGGLEPPPSYPGPGQPQSHTAS